jgi:hypothetical protein
MSATCGLAVRRFAEPLVDAVLGAAGHPIVARPEDAAVVVVSFDRTFHYGKLQAAYRSPIHPDYVINRLTDLVGTVQESP